MGRRLPSGRLRNQRPQRPLPSASAPQALSSAVCLFNPQPPLPQPRVEGFLAALILGLDPNLGLPGAPFLLRTRRPKVPMG